MTSPAKVLYVGESWTYDNQFSTPSSQTFYRTVVCDGTKGTSVAVPNWKFRCKYGQPATSAYSGTNKHYGSRGGHISWFKLDVNPYPPPPLVLGHHGISGRNVNLPGWWNHTSGVTTEAENQALNRLYAAIREERSNFQGLVFLGELKESLALIHGSAKKLARLIPGQLAAQQKLARQYLGSFAVGSNGSAVRLPGERVNLKPKSARSWKDFQRSLSNQWLEFAFGVRPLVMDVRQGAETVARFKFDNHKSRLKGYGKSTDYISSSSNPISANGTVGLQNTRRFRIVECVYRVGYRYESSAGSFESGTARRLAQLSGFDWTQFVPSIWELLPYSFLVDYFVNVGDLLSAMFTETDGIQWINKTIRHTIREESYAGLHAGVPNPSGQTDYAGTEFGSYVAQTESWSRTGPASLDFPSLQFTVPGVTSLRWLNILALLGGSGAAANRGFH